MKPITVVLADDHSLVLEAIASMLEHEVDIEVIGKAGDGRDLVRLVRQHEPNVVVTDIAMPSLNGVDAFLKLHQILPSVKVIFLTVTDSAHVIAKVMRAGAKGFLLKSSAADELPQAIHAVMNGGTYITPIIAEKMIGSLAAGSSANLLDRLTVRQREIVQLLAEGKTMQKAAEILSLTPRTVAFHKYRAMETLEVETSADLIRVAISEGLIS
ncbi:MAG: response regulator transcription factor [Lysobacterales bacterium]